MGVHRKQLNTNMACEMQQLSVTVNTNFWATKSFKVKIKREIKIHDISFTAQHGTEIASTTQIKGPIMQHTILKQSLYISFTVLATAYTVMSSSIFLSVLNEVVLLRMK